MFAATQLAATQLARYWWVLALRGIAAIVFGILAFVWPGMTLIVLVILFGAYALVDGVLGLIAAFGGETQHRVLLAIEGIVSILAGIAAFVWPALTALVLLYIIAFWAIVTGVIEIIEAWRLRHTIRNEWGLIIGGILSILFGIILLARPGAGALAVVLLIGVYAVIFGIMMLVLAWRLREHSLHAPESASMGGAAAAP